MKKSNNNSRTNYGGGFLKPAVMIELDSSTDFEHFQNGTDPYKNLVG